MVEKKDIKNKELPLGNSLLDSSLKSRTLPKNAYDIKVIKCGNYIQYFKNNLIHYKQEEGWEKEKKEKSKEEKRKLIQILKEIEEDNLFNINTNITKEPSIKKIEEKNIIRSKNQMCRLILSNNEIWKSFITLTFSEDVRNIEYANYEFNKFIKKIKRVYPKLSYLVVPEFQKNERIHYHLITNIEYSNNKLINENIQLMKLYQNINIKSNIVIDKNFNLQNHTLQVIKKNDLKIFFRKQDGKWENTKQTFNHKTKQLKTFKTIKYWNKGFTNIMPLNLLCGSNVAGYMAKYMMKDLDNRLFGKKRYFFSQNLTMPVIEYLNSSNEIDKFIFESDLECNEIIFQKKFKDFFKNEIEFIEMKIK